MKLVQLIVIALVTPAFLVRTEDDIDEKAPPGVPVIEAGLQAEGELINREDSAASYGEPVIGSNYGAPGLQIQPISGGYGGGPIGGGGGVIIRQPSQGYGGPIVPQQPFIGGGGISGGYGAPQIQPIRYNVPIYNPSNYNVPIPSYGTPAFRSNQNFYRPPTVGFGSINTINYPRFIHGGNGGGGYSGGGGGFNYQRFYNFRPRFAPVVSGGYS